MKVKEQEKRVWQRSEPWEREGCEKEVGRGKEEEHGKKRLQCELQV